MSTLYLVIGRIWCGFCACADYLPTDATLSKMSSKEEDWCAVLQYADIPKIKKLEALLVQNCSKRLEECGLILCVVSIVLYIQELQA